MSAGLRGALAALWTTALVAGAAPGAAPAAPPATALDHYLEGLNSLRVSFTQSITDSRGHESDRSSGELLVLRPGRFRWDIHPAGGGTGQLLVADGRNLWFFDRDLEQVTVKPMDAALSTTPAMLLSGGVDVHRAFDVKDAGAGQGLEWVKVAPRNATADFREARLGFAHGELKRMVLSDKLGQTATLEFERSERNAAVTPAEVSFTPPAGADVIGSPSR
jgi:outer membrane lipoprotein carrier protein